ncbi:adenylyl-sulfate kinase [Streptomyces sp. O3]
MNVTALAPAPAPASVCTCWPGATVWLTGLPSAGKSTIATALAERLRTAHRRVEVLDGDELRASLSSGLGFSRADRHTNVQRIGMIAEVLARNGILALVPVIAPYEESRQTVRARHERSATAYLEVHVATPVEVCSARDVKGLYARHAEGRLTGLTGVDDPYEIPQRPDARIETQRQSVEQSVVALHALLTQRGLA